MTHKIHVLHILPGLLKGGMEVSTAKIISGLSEMQHSIACLKGEPEIYDLLPPHTEIYCFNSKPNDPVLPFRLAHLLKKLKPHVIHARNWGAWPDIAIARLFAWPTAPLIFSFHGLGKANYMPFRRRIASKVLVKITTYLMTVSRQSREMLANYWGWPPKRTLIIPNGVDTRLFYPKKRAPNKRIIIGSVGNLRPVKNQALLLKAAASLVDYGIDLEIRIAGEGNEREPLRKLANDLNIQDNVFLLGMVDDVPSFLNQLDIFVLSSDSEQHPNALNEAMACGVASIATNVGCVEDLLDGGRCGIIIKPGDVNALTDALYKLIVNDRLRKHYAEAGLKHIRDNYSLEIMINRYRKLYTTAASCPKKQDVLLKF